MRKIFSAAALVLSNYFVILAFWVKNSKTVSNKEKINCKENIYDTPKVTGTCIHNKAAHLG